jgi:hypothetical protein
VAVAEAYEPRRHGVDHVRAVRPWNERGMAGRQPVFSLERKARGVYAVNVRSTSPETSNFQNIPVIINCLV